MALTITYPDAENPERISRNLGVLIGSIAFDASYPTGGETLDLRGRFGTLLYVKAEPTAGYVFTYDYTNRKLLAYYYDNNAVADGAAIQVANTTNLSTPLAAVEFVAFGLWR